MAVVPNEQKCIACGRTMKGETPEIKKVRAREQRERKRIELLEEEVARKMQQNLIWQEVVMALLFPAGGAMQVPHALVAAIRNGQYDDLSIAEGENDVFLVYSKKLMDHIKDAEANANKPKIITDLTMPTPAERVRYGETPVIDISKIRR